ALRRRASRLTLALTLLAACARAPQQPASTPPSPRPEPLAVAPAPTRPLPPPDAAAVEPTAPAPAPELGPRAPEPASAAQVQQLFGSPEDPEPQVRGGITKALEDVSYIVGNEWSLDAFRAAVQDLGGGYIGVGPDQAYLFIGWQRPEFAWLIDYDPKVMRVHAMYRALLQAFERRRDFLAAFEHDHADATSELLAQHEDPRLRRMYRNNRDMFRWRLRTIERKLARRGVPCWLTDDETYAYVRKMVLGDRVRPLRVNLVDDVGMAGIAEAARALGVTVRVVYLSNAEEYWERYEPQFVANLAALPIDERALVLRTRLVWQVNRDYVYNAQSLAEFLAWLQTPGVDTLEDIVGPKPKAEAGRINFVHTTALPPAAGS
ncbi:MAG: hypothetical protein K1X88_36335, partial [Nannocystaceae bacterium]|nr:hypothetical protein [Nannocystaceae bacterium]